GGDADTLLETYQLSRPAEWEGSPILHRSARNTLMNEEQEQLLRSYLDELGRARENRIRPGRDDKVLVDWNGLAITALASAGRVFERGDWIEAAKRAYAYICSRMREDRLPHSIRGDAVLFPGLASDYAAMIRASIELYQTTVEEELLNQAVRWASVLDRWHADETQEGYYLTASDSTDVPIRVRGDIDEAIPSSSSQLIEALTKRSIITGDDALYNKTLKMAAAASARVENLLYGQVGVVHAASLAQKPRKLMINDPVGSLASTARQIIDPRRVDIMVGPRTSRMEEASGISIDRDTMGAWLCIGQSCLPPITKAEELREALL